MEPTPDLTILGERPGWDTTPSAFGLLPEERPHHLYLIGQTGTGKSTLLRNLILQDIERGHGVGFVDPHGDDSLQVLDTIPPHRTNDVVYFDPADPHPASLNLFRTSPRWSQAAAGIVASFRHIWADSWGPRMEYILLATIAALLQCESSSLLGISRMFTDVGFRNWVVRQVEDPVIATFWTHEFPVLERAFRGEATSPIQNKVGALFFSEYLRYALGQVNATVDFRDMMDTRKIFIANLSKGKLGETGVKFLGALIVNAFELAALGRADATHRPPFHLYCDEFQNYATSSFGGILSEARKYGLSFTLAHQHVSQIEEDLSRAVFGNVGSMVVFRVGEHDAQQLERQLGGRYTASQLTGLANYEVCVRLMGKDAFFGKTLYRNNFVNGRADIVRRASRERYGTPIDVIERKINQWLTRTY